MKMRKSLNFTRHAVIAYCMIIGAIVCILTTNSFVLTLIEKAIETKLNPFNIMDWIWVLIGS